MASAHSSALAASTATVTPLPTATPLPTDLALAPDGIVLYSGPERYGGDIITQDARPMDMEGLDPHLVTVRGGLGSAAGRGNLEVVPRMLNHRQSRIAP